jgi:hypothetical protein
MMFTKNIRIIYLYLMSLIFLFMSVGGFVSLVNNVSSYLIEEQIYYTSSLRGIFSSVAVVIVSLPLYIYHWNSIKKERVEEKE